MQAWTPYAHIGALEATRRSVAGRRRDPVALPGARLQLEDVTVHRTLHAVALALALAQARAGVVAGVLEGDRFAVRPRPRGRGRARSPGAPAGLFPHSREAPGRRASTTHPTASRSTTSAAGTSAATTSAWYEQLRSTLNADGYSAVQIVGADSDWTIANDLVSNPTFASAVQIVGAHYPCGYLSSESSCPSTANAVATGKQLWASENGSEDSTPAPRPWPAPQPGYIDGQMTATINWPVVAAIYPEPAVPHRRADRGHPAVVRLLHGRQERGSSRRLHSSPRRAGTTSTRPAATCGGNRSDGSYVTLKSPNGSDWSSIIETMDATAAQTVTYNVSGGLSTGTVHVWSTNVSSASPSNWFVHASDITPSGGSFSLTVQPGFVYSLTTTTGQGKGTAASPGPGTLALPYSDSFDSDTAGTSLATSHSSRARSRWSRARRRPVRAVPAAAGRRQADRVGQATPTPTRSAATCPGPTTPSPPTCCIEQAGAVQLLGRASTQKGFSPADIDAYYFQVANTGAWSIFRNNTSGTITTLASGTVAALGTGTWHHLALSFNGHTISGAIDGTTVGTVTDTTYTSGMAGLGRRRLPDRPVRQPVGDARSAVDHADRADHRR